MAASLRIGSVETFCSGFQKSCLSTSSSRRFVCVKSLAGPIRFSCGKRDDGYRPFLKISCEGGGAAAMVEKDKTLNISADGSVGQLSCVMKFGCSSVASAERMKAVAELILSFGEERPVIVLSAMGKTTNKLLLAGEKAVSCGVSNVSDIDELGFIKELHLNTADELGVDRSTVSALLDELEQLLKGIAMMKELTLQTRDYLVSFGECMSTRIFAAYLNKIGAKARQYDAFTIGFTTTDDFTNADILDATYPAVSRRLHGDWCSDPAIPVVTGFLGKGWKSCAVTTLGRGGSDLTATTISKALGIREIQVWKDVDGVLTCDPNIYPRAEPAPYLTFDEAVELAYFGAQVLHPQSIKPAREGDNPVGVKNSYNPKALGTLITESRDMIKAVTNIGLKMIATMLDRGITGMPSLFSLLVKFFSTFEDLGLSVDVATSEVNLSRELIQQVSGLHVQNKWTVGKIKRTLKRTHPISGPVRLLGQIWQHVPLSPRGQIVVKLAFQVILWAIWISRNEKMFNNKVSWVDTVILRVAKWALMIGEFLNFKIKDFFHNLKACISSGIFKENPKVTLEPPPAGGKPGLAGIGGVVRNSFGNNLASSRHLLVSRTLMMLEFVSLMMLKLLRFVRLCAITSLFFLLGLLWRATRKLR